MTRDELIERLHTLAQEAEGGGLKPAASILLSLCGALYAGAECELMSACADFSRRELERLTGQPDWDEDVLRV